MTRLLCFIILIHSCCLYLLIPPVRAAEYGVTASLKFREGYDDNVFFKGVSDFAHEITPSLALAAVTENSSLQAGASLDITDYQRHDELDTVDQYYQILAGLSPTPRLLLDLTGTYVLDHTFRSALEETGIIADRDKRKKATVSPMATFRLAPRDQLQLFYGLSSTQFEDDRTADYVDHDLRLSWRHALRNERTNVVLILGGSDTDYGDTINNPGEKLRQRSVGGVMGFDHQLSETSTLRLVAGPRYTNSEFRGSEKDDEQSVGFLGDAVLTWRSERTTVSMKANQGYVPSTRGENVNRSRVNLDLGYRLTERLGCRLSGYYRYSETENEETTIKSQAFAVQPEVVYQLPWPIKLRLAYSYTWTEDKVANNTDDRNVVFLEIRWLIHKPEWKVRQPRALVRWPWR